ncbi:MULTISPECIES: DinB family protein [Paenibacillus]|uniref:DinB family protein n=1 Tax=Paenibacillus TaxID=44249 RepID=UPI001576BBE1|nr:DinB family protein [Paenibacillus sp. JMULE4]NTZ18078.1 DinB family protein [Paenibacillus sp. JMULE4]
MSELQDRIQSIHRSIDQIVEITQDLDEEILRFKPADDAWSVMEILCHVEEATPYWLNELTQVIASPGIEWGRGLQHEGRLNAVAQAGQRTKDEVLKGIIALKSKVRDVLGPLTAEDLTVESPSRNPRFGTKPMAFIVDHLLVEHVETHLKQIKRNLRQYEDAKGK